jgi:hypothetical protein
MDIEQDLNEQYVRVVHYLGETITGRYDGKDFEFPDGHDGTYRDVKREVAHHIFGFMNPNKEAALLRLGWLGGKRNLELREALELLALVQFHEVPPFPHSVGEFRKPKAESAARVGPTHAPMGQGGSVSSGEDAPPKTLAKKA